MSAQSSWRAAAFVFCGVGLVAASVALADENPILQQCRNGCSGTIFCDQAVVTCCCRYGLGPKTCLCSRDENCDGFYSVPGWDCSTDDNLPDPGNNN